MSDIILEVLKRADKPLDVLQIENRIPGVRRDDLREILDSLGGLGKIKTNPAVSCLVPKTYEFKYDI